MIREFLTYLPLWFPVQKRGKLLSRQACFTTAINWFMMLCGLKADASLSNVMPGTLHDCRCRALLIYAYARDSEKPFAQDSEQWQLAWAKCMGEMLQKETKAENYLRSDRKSLYELTNLEFTVTGIHNPTKELKFHWIEMFCSVDIDLLWDYVSGVCERLEQTYVRRWADPRYAFASQESCPYPSSIDDLWEATPFQLGLLFDSIFRYYISRWNWSRCRDVSYWGIRRLSHMRGEPLDNDVLAAIRLKQPLITSAIDGPYTDRIQDIAASCSEISGESGIPVYDGFLYHKLPATIIQQMDNLVEEIDHATQCQGQQGAFCESTESSAGSNSNQT